MLALRNSAYLMRPMPPRTLQHTSRPRRFRRPGIQPWFLALLLMPFALLIWPQAGAGRTRRVTHSYRVVRSHRYVRRSPHWGCWIDIFAGADYAPPSRRIVGPINLPNLKLADKNWGDAITSIKTGPRTWAKVYKDPNYRGEYLIIHPNSAHRSLRPLKFKDSIDSIIVRNHPF